MYDIDDSSITKMAENTCTSWQDFNKNIVKIHSFEITLPNEHKEEIIL